ncbi:unnamed protein product [Haemonchus placei]|uniref:Uncharacterized protein n=1 Tax=Haemonchus placei TaxID=6290 RepID=A0A0N4WYK7_HAEPC|nr:unnamed protein product [Haemonchus placei]
MEVNFKGIRQDALECVDFVFAFQTPRLADYRVLSSQAMTVNDDSKVVKAVDSSEIRTVHKRKKRRLTRHHHVPEQHWTKGRPQNRNAISAAQESRTAPRRHIKQILPCTWYQRDIGRIGDVQKHTELDIMGFPFAPT